MIRCLHVGFDGLDVSFMGALPATHLNQLKAMKEQAQRVGAAAGEFGGLCFTISPSGSRGG